MSTPWRGIVAAAALPFKNDFSIDFDAYQEHVSWLCENGCDGVSPNGSLGEYQTLSDKERADVVCAAVEAAPAGASVVPGTGAYGGAQSRHWAEQALEAGAHAVLSLPPATYRASVDEVVAHYAEINKVGLPIVAYNNPYDTNVDLTPDALARVGELENIVAVKEFSADLRRVHQIRRLAPHIDVLAGADDVLVELVLMGAVGWIGGFSNATPVLCRRLYDLALAGEVAEARALYTEVHAAFCWDSRHTFVQAIKLAMDMAGRYGGACRLPRLPLPAELESQVRADIEQALALTLV